MGTTERKALALPCLDDANKMTILKDLSVGVGALPHLIA